MVTRLSTCCADALRVLTRQVHPGDELRLSLAPPPPMEAAPEDLPLEVRRHGVHAATPMACHSLAPPRAGGV